MSYLRHVSSSGKQIGIWNDATRCVDLSDVTIFDPSEGLSFIELKQGKVNEAIFETIQAGTVAAIDSFFNSFGEKGFRQLERTVKQEIDAQSHELLLKTDNLIDPFLGTYRETITPTVIAESYDTELTECLARVRTLNSAFLTIDKCLHLVSSTRSASTGREANQSWTNTFLVWFQSQRAGKMIPAELFWISLTGLRYQQQCPFFSGVLTLKIFPDSA